MEILNWKPRQIIKAICLGQKILLMNLLFEQNLYPWKLKNLKLPMNHYSIQYLLTGFSVGIDRTYRRSSDGFGKPMAETDGRYDHETERPNLMAI
jgi:hypothetical protein